MATISEAFSVAFLHHRAGRLDFAETIYREILKVEPEFADALQLLGAILLKSQRFQDAVIFIRRALKSNWNLPHAHNNLGEAHLGLREFSEAVACYHRAIQLNPNYAVAHCNLGNIHRDLGEMDEAITHYRRAIELKPELAEAHTNLGLALMMQGRLKDAESSFRKVIELNPCNPEAYNHLGQVLQEMGSVSAALSVYQQGLKQKPDSAPLHYNLGRLFAEMEQPDRADRHYGFALSILPNFAEAHHGRGLLLHSRGHLDQALQHLLRAIALRSNFPLAYCGIGMVQQEKGDLVGAQCAFEKARRLDENCADAYTHLASLRQGQLTNADLARMRLLTSSNRLTNQQRAGLCFGLARVEDDAGQFSRAAVELRRGHELILEACVRRGKQYNRGDHDRFVSQLIATFDSQYFQRVRSYGNDSVRPLIIMGLPRSGTTLTEQILAGHSQVHAGGELGLTGSTMAALPKRMAAKVSVAESARYLDSPLTQLVAAEYLEQLHALNSTALRITDKLPDNYLYVGLFVTLFPRAKIIHCRRQSRDVALSCWMTNFRDLDWNHQFENIAARFRAYERIMAHWRRTLPTPILDVDYEETVSDLRGTAERLLDWCDLEWEPDCINFHERRNPVRTASSTQVRHPIHSRSVGRSKNYEQDLASLFELLPTT